MDKLKIAIIGGGIAGLSAAYFLDKHAKQRNIDLAITVLETHSRWGGKIHTEEQAGYLIEEGPDSFLVSKPWALQLFEELGISDQLIPTNPIHKKTYILHKGLLVPMPKGLFRMIPADLRALMSSHLFSWLGKLRMLMDFVLPTKHGRVEESLRQFITRRMGPEAYDRLFGPLTTGVYGGDGDQLSAEAVLPHLIEMEAKYGSLLRGARQAKKEEMAKAKNQNSGSQSVFLTPRGGMSTLVKVLLAHLKARDVQLLKGHAAHKVSVTDFGNYAINFEAQEDIESDGVILAIPAYAAARLLDQFNPNLASELASIKFAPAIVVSLAYKRQDIPHPLDAYGYLIPRAEGRAALACTWTSSKFDFRAPKDGALLRVFFNQNRDDDKELHNNDHYIELARQELKDTLGIRVAPRFTSVQGWSQAMPQYELGHFERLQRIENLLHERPGLLLAGNSYYGIGIPDTIFHSQQAAISLLDNLEDRLVFAKHEEHINEH